MEDGRKMMGFGNPISWALGAAAAAAKAATKNQGSATAPAAGWGNGNGGLGGKTSYVNDEGQKKSGVFVPSASSVGVGNSTQQKIKDQMNANSQAWHTAATQAEKDRLHRENLALASQLGGGISYNGSAGTWSGNAGYDPYGDAIDNANNQYSQMQANQEAAARAGVDRAVGNLSGQKEGINQSYSDLFRQLYIDKMKGERDLPQQMAAMGYTGGLSESALMDLQNGYANNLRQGEQGRTSSLSEIDRAITDTQLQGDISIAEQAAQLAQQGLLTYADLIKARQDQSYRYGRDAVADKQYDSEWSYGMEQDSMAAARAEVDRILASGEVPPADLVSKAKYTPAYVQAQRNAYLQQAAPKHGGYSGRYSGGSANTEAVGQDYEHLFLAAQQSGNPASFLKQKSNYKKYGFDAQPDFSDYKNWLGTENTGLNQSHFKAFGQSVAAQLASGRAGEASDNVSTRWATLNGSQKAEIMALLKKYGYAYTED